MTLTVADKLALQEILEENSQRRATLAAVCQGEAAGWTSRAMSELRKPHDQRSEDLAREYSIRADMWERVVATLLGKLETE